MQRRWVAVMSLPLWYTREGQKIPPLFVIRESAAFPILALVRFA
jgi:hypothetical protein